MGSTAFFNFAGVSITKHMSATTRKVLDTLRTLVIWLLTILFHYVISEEDWKMPRWRDQFFFRCSVFSSSSPEYSSTATSSSCPPSARDNREKKSKGFDILT